MQPFQVNTYQASSSYHELVQKNPTLKLEHYSHKIMQLKTGMCSGLSIMIPAAVVFSFVTALALYVNFSSGSPDPYFLKVILSAGGGVCGPIMITGIAVLSITQYLLRKKRTPEEIKERIQESIESLKSGITDSTKVKSYFEGKITRLEADQSALTSALDEVDQ